LPPAQGNTQFVLHRMASPAAPSQDMFDPRTRIGDPQAAAGLGHKGGQPAPAGSASSYDLGLTLLAMGEHAAARAALREAASHGPNRRAAARKLGSLLILAADRAACEAAIRLAETAPEDAPPAAINLPDARLQRAEREVRAEIAGMPPDVAELLLRDRLRLSPTDAARLRVLADLATRRSLHGDAERLLERALDLAPNYTGARHGYALALFRQGKEDRAVSHVEQLLAQHPNELPYRILLASCLAAVGNAERAIALYEAALLEAPNYPDLIHSYAQALKTAGRRDDSVRALRTCINVAPDSGQAYWNMINIGKTPPARADIEAMRAQLATNQLSPDARFHFNYALGHALEKLGDFAGSFRHYAEGAKLRRNILDYRPGDVTIKVRQRIRFFSAAFFASRRGSGDPSAAPIFVLGMPRAGSTLIEQILTSHSAVEGTRELPEIWCIANELRQAAQRESVSPYPECLARLQDRDFAELGRRYLEHAAFYRSTDRPFFVDKMPSNWLETGFIHAILPNARIIDARRDPMANGFGAFSMFFSQGMEFSYGLRDIGLYYNDYLNLMEHYDGVLPGRVHRVLYENVVNDTETEIRRLLDYCGLPFEAACLRFWENKRVVTTASAEQVRRPIFREGLDHWRNYQPWLEPLRQALNERKPAANPQGS
jgi:tetratricopeptide (TPR) repeat protein